MSTNFYWACLTEVPNIIYYGNGTEQYLKLRGNHIGKKSGAGYFCWSCKITLCKNGEKAIHIAKNEWHDFCPTCGATKESFKIINNEKFEGVGYVYTFNWAESPDSVENICKLHLNKKIIVDENECKYTGNEFIQMLKKDCPYNKYSSIGTTFS